MSNLTNTIIIHDVWANNLDEEFSQIREIVDEYRHVALDVKFPGPVIRRVGTFDSPADYRYQTLCTNVELLHPIRITLAFFVDAPGDLSCSPCVVWKFNFREFDIGAHDIANPEAVELLRRCGVDFVKHREQGIRACDFGERLMSSGAVLLGSDVEWITFDGGYVIAFLLRILTGRRLPETREEFSELVKTFFPTLYDVKHLTTFCDDLDGGLVDVAKKLGVENIGVRDQAGCDSSLTARVFTRMKQRYFDGSIEQYCLWLHGLDLDN